MLNFFKKHNITALLLGLASIELFSFFGFLNPQAGIILFWLIIAATIAASLWRLEYGLLVVLAELFIGSKGYLFSLNLGGTVISIRMALFLIIMAIWLSKNFKNIFEFGFWNFIRNWKLKIGNFYLWYSILFAALGIGLVQAIILRNSYSDIFFDFNAFLFFAYLFPLSDTLREKANWERLAKVAIAAIGWVIMKTFIIFYIFAHGMWLYTPSAYKWIRDTGVGEITKMDQGFFRVFFQGHIYELLFLIISLGVASWYFLRKEYYSKIEFPIFNFQFPKLIWIVNAALFAVVILSFSRSFWVGGGIGLIILFGLMIFGLKAKWRAIGLFSLYIFGIFATGFILIFALMNVPSRKGKPVSLSNLVSERATTEEAAGQSRMESLKPIWKGILKHPIIGSGFGATITYNSKDPRVLQNNPSGAYTTFAFEWGYLDLWYKMGILGPIAILGLIGGVLLSFWRVMKNQSVITLFGINAQALALGVFAALITLAAVHFFTPYLNHPLGIGFVILSSIFAVFIRDKSFTI